ncbi:hypothetical protein BGZ99_000934 [Dissophora globulifera]|uniref:Uncharacterized protein n=1 Tax=Dissophora globulifera TaxID=979702 RepID=A0A9P6RRY2_9FUNG|nr:hypothetical protein BGZ99_000934 [Dissophora globulifera]
MQAHLMYFFEPLARDDEVRKIKPLQWSKITASIGRLFGGSSGSGPSPRHYIEGIMYWKNPLETLTWFTGYFTLWYYKMWLPGFVFAILFKILKNRNGNIGDGQKSESPLDVPEIPEDTLPQVERKRSSIFHDLMGTKDLRDMISQVTNIWGPYIQALLEENIFYLERIENLIQWKRPAQTWRVVTVLGLYLFVSTFLQHLVVPGVGLFIGIEFFILLPLQKYSPRFSHVFSPVEWILWNVPRHAELAVEQFSLLRDNDSGFNEAVDLMPQVEKNMRHSASVLGLTPAPKTKYDFQRQLGGRRELNCVFRGEPGSLLITKDVLRVRVPRPFGLDDLVTETTWESIETIRKSKSGNLLMGSSVGIDVTDNTGQVMALIFRKVERRDEAFRELMVTSGKDWIHVA